MPDGTDTPFGDNRDKAGEINILQQQLGPLGQLLSMLTGGVGADQLLMNNLLGNQFAGQQARLGGRTPRLHDIMAYENQKTFFDFSTKAMQDQRQDQRQTLLTGIYGSMGFDNAGTRAANSVNSIYNPVGLASRMAMLSYGEAGSKRALAQGFMGMNMYAPTVDQGINSAAVQARQATMNGFVDQMRTDYYSDPNGYGGFNLQGQAEVFQQMSQRSLIGRGDVSNRAQATSQKVKDMSQAVGAMQELFGGTIPELFDKMDAIFGGNASAMGGQALMGRVLRMKQTSRLTGQSLNSLAQMNIMGGRYAQAAGMDAGIGAAAAEETSLALGVNYAGGLASTRRINAGRLRTASLQVNTAAATSRMSQYYAGAYMTYLDKNGLVDNEANSAAFADAAGGATSIGALAQAAGGSVYDVRQSALSNRAKELMADDENVRRFGVRSRVNRAQGAIGRAMRRAAMGAAGGRNIDMSVFMNKGQLRDRTAIISDLESKYGISRSNAEGIIDNQFEQAGAALFNGMNAQEVEAYLFQTRNSGQLRELRDKRAALDKELGGGTGGVLGVMTYLAGRAGEKGDAKMGEVMSAMLGVITPEQARKGITRAQMKKKGMKLADDFQTAYASYDGSGRYAMQSKTATVMAALTSGGALSNMDPKKREELRQKITDGTLTDDDINFAFSELATDKQKLAATALEESGLEDDYANAMRGSTLDKAKTIGRDAAMKKALKGIKDDKIRERVRSALYKDEGADDDPKSIREARERLKNTNFGDADRKKFFADLDRTANALDAGDEKVDMKDILSRLADVLETLSNERPISTKGLRTE